MTISSFSLQKDISLQEQSTKKKHRQAIQGYRLTKAINNTADVTEVLG